MCNLATPQVVFTGNSFAPPALLSLRLGDRLRDVVANSQVTDSPVTAAAARAGTGVLRESCRRAPLGSWVGIRDA